MAAMALLLLQLFNFYIRRDHAGVIISKQMFVFFLFRTPCQSMFSSHLHLSLLPSFVHVPSHTLAQLQRPRKTAALVKASLRTAITLPHPPPVAPHVLQWSRWSGHSRLRMHCGCVSSEVLLSGGAADREIKPGRGSSVLRVYVCVFEGRWPGSWMRKCATDDAVASLFVLLLVVNT